MPITLARQTAGRLHAAAARDPETMAQLGAELNQIRAWNTIVYARARLAAERAAARAERKENG